MEDRIKEIIKEAITTKMLLLYDESLIKKIRKTAELIKSTLKRGGKIFVFGNGGSAADSQHFAAELVGRFQKERKGLAACSLTTDTSILTSLANDYSFNLIFKRQLEALATSRDIAIGLSTSGNSKNVLAGIRQAKAMGLKTIGFTGQPSGKLGGLVDIVLNAPSKVTARIQEIHGLLIHIICEIVEEAQA
jgi:D-sedoheptulose 7-phosphate isomerase